MNRAERVRTFTEAVSILIEQHWAEIAPEWDDDTPAVTPAVWALTVGAIDMNDPDGITGSATYTPHGQYRWTTAGLINEASLFLVSPDAD